MRCEAMRFKSGMQCGLPKGHSGQHSRADGATNICWDEDSARYPECPVFAIKASDPFSCAIIRLWVTMAASYKGKEISPGIYERVSSEKIKGAEERLTEFLRWQLEHGWKVPD